MKDSTTFDRAAHCRRIAGSGGRATVQRHGRQHMSEIGRRGFQSTTERYFRNEFDHKQWLASAGAHMYWRSTSLPMRYDRNGHPCWPEEMPAHPAHKEYTEF